MWIYLDDCSHVIKLLCIVLSMQFSEWKWGPFSMSVCVECLSVIFTLHTLCGFLHRALCCNLNSFFCLLIHDKKTSVHMDYQMFSIKGGVQSYNLCPGNYETSALALGHLGFSSLWGLSRKEGPPVSSPQFSAQMERGTMCWRNFKEVCVWERPESLEAPWIEREAFFFYVIPWS